MGHENTKVEEEIPSDEDFRLKEGEMTVAEQRAAKKKALQEKYAKQNAGPKRALTMKDEDSIAAGHVEAPLA